MLSAGQVSEFSDRGLLRLPGFLPEDNVAAAQDAVFGVFARRGIWKDGKWQMEHLGLSQAPGAGRKLAHGAKGHPALTKLLTTELQAAVLQLSGGRPIGSTLECPQILFTLPNAGAWIVPATIWHLDVPRLPGDDVPGVQMFTFLSDVEAEGGGGAGRRGVARPSASPRAACGVRRARCCRRR